MASIQDDQPALVPLGGEIRHHAEPVCLLAAPTRATRFAERARHPADHAAPSGLRSAHKRAAVRPLRHPARRPRRGIRSRRHRRRRRISDRAAGAALHRAERVIALPRQDGGVTLHGSLQCPYYIQSALKRSLALDAVRTIMIQTETGGGFGGKEDYPSMIATHAALLALKAGRAGPDDLRPPRGPRRHHKAAPPPSSATGPASCATEPSSPWRLKS